MTTLTEQIARVGVVGGGLMGCGVAEVCARTGLGVIVIDLDQSRLTTARSRIAASLARAVHSGKFSAADRDSAMDRIRFSADLADLADRDLVVEAVIEQETAKVDLFARLD